MIVISKMTTGDSLIINEKNNSQLYDATARVSRTKTIDGGVVVDHQGFVDGDRSLNINCDLTAAEELILRTLFENETIVHVATKNGFYAGAIERLRGDNGNIEFQVMLKETA